jgi:hypothetical protein
MAIIKVKTGGITADAITDALIADDVVGTEHLTANEVDTTALGADAVTGAQLADDAVNSEHYTDGSVDTAHIADVNVTQGKIADQAINEAKMQISNAPTNGYMLTAQSGNTGGLTWAEAVGGKLLQVVNSTTHYFQSNTSTSYADVESSSGVAWETAITPSATSSTILVMASIMIYNSENSSSNTQQENRYNLHLDSKTGSGSYGAFLEQGSFGHYYYDGEQRVMLDPATRSFTKMHSPSTTSAVTYKFQYAMGSSGGKVSLGGSSRISSITLMEIAG